LEEIVVGDLLLERAVGDLVEGRSL
jgi:hypothetical protein